MSRILKICISTWTNASRDKRELSVCRELGMDIMVMAKGERTGDIETVDGFTVHRVSSRPLGMKAPAAINRFLSVFTWAHEARKLQPDIISGHDFIALTIGYLSNCFLPEKKKAKLVYDSHEFELGRDKKRSKLTLAFIKWLEGFLMRRSAFSIMVNDSIADEVQRIHQLQHRPVVVRNVANYWVLNDEAIEKQRRAFITALQVPPETFFIMYHGAIMEHRSIEVTLRALARTDGVAAVILGNGEREYVNRLQRLCEELDIQNRVLFLPAVPLSQLVNYIAATDLGMVNPGIARKNIDVLNSYFSLPNKLFENIQAKTPVIVPDYPETGGLVKRYGIGLAIEATDSEEERINAIKEAILRMRDDTVFYQSCKENLSAAKEELHWEREKEALKAEYAKLRFATECGVS